MNQAVKGAVCTLAVCIASELLFKLWKRCRNAKDQTRSLRQSGQFSRPSSFQQSIYGDKNAAIGQQNDDDALQVLFFPDKTVACREYFVGDGCFKDNCGFSHTETSLSRLFQHLLSVKRTMDVCVFLITCKDLAHILLKLHKKGIKIRIITDSEQLNCDGSQIWSLLKAGIPVRTHKSRFLMHHKFVVQDSQILINGSFNWTRQAITGNHENVFITKGDVVTSSFVEQFEQLWQEFSPLKAKTGFQT